MNVEDSKKYSIRDYEIVSKVQDYDNMNSNTYVVRRLNTSIKRIARLFSIVDYSTTDVKRILNEMKILASIRHPNVLMYHDSYVDDKTGILVMVTEYCEEGNLRTYLDGLTRENSNLFSKRGYFMEEHDVLGIVVQVVLGMREVRRFGVIHRNIKISNVYLNKDGTAKLADFIFANFENLNRMATQIGTPQYASPEVMLGIPYTLKSDIWSLGILMYELSFGCLPFVSDNIDELKEKIMNRDFQFPNVAKGKMNNVMTLIDWCLDIDPEERPSLEDILQQKYLVPFLKRTFDNFPELAIREKSNNKSKKLQELNFDPKTKDYAALNTQLKELRKNRVQYVLDGVDDIDVDYYRLRDPTESGDSHNKINLIEENVKMTYEIRKFANSRDLDYTEFRKKEDRLENIMKAHKNVYENKLITPDKPLILQGEKYAEHSTKKRWNYPLIQ